MNRLLILEMQDGMMCKNDKDTVKMMIDKAIENKPDHIDLIFKWQMYTKIKTYVEIIPLKRDIFIYAYEYAKQCGYQTTASVFDEENLEFIKTFDVPFIKVACQTDLYDFRKKMWHLIDPDYNNIVSVENEDDYIRLLKDTHNTDMLSCIPKYPATIKDYEIAFSKMSLILGISDHTIGLDLYNKYKPRIFEKHYYVDGLESWDKDWAIKPEEFKLL